MLLIGRLQKNILLLVVLFSHLSGISYTSLVKSNLEEFFPNCKTSISLADGNNNPWGLFCVAKEDADPTALQLGLDWACGPGLADCGPIQPGQPCYVANNLVAIASYAYDAYYQAYQATGGTCFFNNTAKLTYDDPSSACCIFPGSPRTRTNPDDGSGGDDKNINSLTSPSTPFVHTPPFAPFVPMDGENGV